LICIGPSNLTNSILSGRGPGDGARHRRRALAA
jgi:hypothetical protein